MRPTTFLMIAVTTAPRFLSGSETPPLRDLSADRPDTTESPISIDRGHWQIETSFFDWSRDADTGSDTHTILATNLKCGLSHRSDLQFVFDAYALQKDGPADRRGFGDVQLRYKLNLWGNDGGTTAFALLPFVKFPTGTALSNGEWEGGLAIPWSTGLTDRLSLGLMLEVDAAYDEDDDRHETEIVHTAVLGAGLTERMSAFIEYIGVAGDFSYQSYASGGLVITVNDNLALDLGFRAGLNNAAEEVGLFSGMTARF